VRRRPCDAEALGPQVPRDGGGRPPSPRGGWASPVDPPALYAFVNERPDMTTDELTRAYNRRVALHDLRRGRPAIDTLL